MINPRNEMADSKWDDNKKVEWLELKVTELNGRVEKAEEELRLLKELVMKDMEG